MAIKFNNETGHYFQTKKGIRQGEPLSPTLFNIVAYMLTVMIGRGKEDGQLRVLSHTLLMVDCLSFNMQTTQLFL